MKKTILLLVFLSLISCNNNTEKNSTNAKNNATEDKNSSCECLVNGQPSSELYGYARKMVEEIKSNTGYRTASLYEINKNEYNPCIFHIKYKYNEFEYGNVGDQFDTFTIECKDGQIIVK